jgi:hypothetical protein
MTTKGGLQRRQQRPTLFAQRGQREGRMDTLTVLIVVSVSTLVIIVLLVLLTRNRGTRQFDRSVVATITQIKVEASATSNWWVVIAQWSDSQRGQILVFRSPHLKFSPKHRVGEGIKVKLNASRPKHYHMEL